MTRRDFLSSLIPAGGIRDPSHRLARNHRDPAVIASAASVVAVIAGRHCLAYQGTFCSTCRERCPVAGAIVVERGMPRVVADRCNGCRICHDVCPAPINAIRLVPFRAGNPAHA